MEAILAWALTHWPYVVFLILCIVFAIWATCKVMAFYHTRFTPIEREIKDIRGSVDRIEKYLIDQDPKAAVSALVKAKSPKTLTELGKTLLNECGGGKFVDANLETLISEINKLSPKSPLDVENYAIEVLLKVTDNSEFTPIKNFIFNNPEFKDTPIQLYAVINVISVYLRDKYFERFPQSQESGSM